MKTTEKSIIKRINRRIAKNKKQIKLYQFEKKSASEDYKKCMEKLIYFRQHENRTLKEMLKGFDLSN